ncbi:Xanthine dehydrogenase iron-sulfur subunit / Xanthine dehydrogenase, FAD binding subunit [hydrothermal vent metagenome]|uniref:Xanthine dehydrogenase iron-sulfur subunit / Xanthine dehydrogenase, FAD binding subunit n=1 Tax=hydrothermal vent metagenome TaxID=652676 RepID=A0A3B0UA10_9ZZZZ
MNYVGVRTTVRFLLNDTMVELKELLPTLTLLDFLRLDRGLAGAKEGCAEGDCGACTVLVGRVKVNGLVYESINSCIRFVASLDGCHVVTIEHLAGKNGALHPVQQALVDYHGSQCGFCTPGMVMSLYGHWMARGAGDAEAIKEVLQGNLCRCTGYKPIVDAGQAVLAAGGEQADKLLVEREQIITKLESISDNKRVEIAGDDGHFILPANVDDLAKLLVEKPHLTIVSGATDVGLWVTKQMREISPIVFISNLDQLRMIVETEDALSIGAGVTYADFQVMVKKHFPELLRFWSRIGGAQVRNAGTIGGNIANGSPIGDMAPLLIALGAQITLRYGSRRRFLPLEDYFISYGKQDRKPGEFIESISIPYPDPQASYAAYKISKRHDEDISSVCGVFYLKLDQDNRVTKITVVFGGMAGIPARAPAVEKSLMDQQWNQETVFLAMKEFSADYTPLSDFRASAEYRLLVAQNLLHRFYLETIGQVSELKRRALL